MVVAGVTRSAEGEGARELFLELYADGDREPWMYVGDGSTRALDVDVSTARRLSRALADYLASVS